MRIDNIEIADTGASMDAETVVTYGDDSFSAHVLTPGGVGGGMPVNSPDSDYWWHIGNVAVNSDLNRLAIVFQEGRIHLQKISTSGNFPLGRWDVLAKGKEDQLQPVQEAIFDPGGKWLAIVRGQDLIVWKVSGWKRKILQEHIVNVGGMKFNPSSELLFIGADNAIRAISLKGGDFIFEAQAPGITSLEISDDNRLLFWGDENETVHMWGIPASK
jgi:WD40 repeat protein